MTPRERFISVYQGKMPDRMPITFHIWDHARIITKVYPDVDPLDYSTINLKSIELSKQLGADVMVRMLYDAHDPLFLATGGQNTEQETENWEVRTEEIQDGNTLIKRTTFKTPEGELHQDYAINTLPNGQSMHACTEKPIKSPADLELAIKYEPAVDEELLRKKLLPKVQILRHALGEDGFLGIWPPNGPFNLTAKTFDMTELYTLFWEDYPFYEKLMNFTIERSLGFLNVVKEARPDVLIIGGNIAGGQLGPKVYEQYVLPFEKRYIDCCQDTGIPAMYHNCGQIMSLLELYKKLGTRSVENFAPPPGGDADLVKMKEIVGTDYVTVGGIDKLELLRKGTTSQIKKTVAESVKALKPGGNHILQNADSLEYDTPVENLRTYVEAALEHAWY